MTITINSRENLTYEEIYEGYQNGKSRLPKTLKDIEAGVGANDSDSMTAKANASGVEIKRRRTGGGNASDTTGLGLSGQPTVARLLSKARYDELLAAYSPLGAQPSQNFIDADVRGVCKNPFDLIDFVSGIDNADQLRGSGNALATRAAKLKALGSNVVIRDFTEIVPANIDVRAKFGDRVGGGGATGEVHGVDQGIPGIQSDTASQAKIVGTGDGSSDFAMGPDTTLGLDLGESSQDIVYTNGTLTLDEAAQETNAGIVDNGNGNTASAIVKGDNVVLHGDEIGQQIEVTEANTVLGFATQVVLGQTAGAYGLASDDTEITVPAAATDVKNRIAYGTYQFGTLRIFTSINDAEPVAYVLHPDLLDDLVVGIA
jgi:hypothetical protein